MGFRANPNEYVHPNMRGLSVVAFGSLGYGGAATGQLSSNTQNDLIAAAQALPVTYYNSNLLPTTGGRLIGLEVMMHFGTAPIDITWHVWVNTVLVPAFDCLMVAGGLHTMSWPAAAFTFAAGTAAAPNYVNVSFEAAAPMPGNYRPAAYVYFESTPGVPAP